LKRRIPITSPARALRRHLREQLGAHAGQVVDGDQRGQWLAQQGVVAVAELGGRARVGIQHVLVGQDHHAVGQHPHQLTELFFALAQQAPRLLAFGDVLQRAQHPRASGIILAALGAQVHHQGAPVHRQQRQQHIDLHRLAGAHLLQQLFAERSRGRIGRDQQLVEAVPAPGFGRAPAEQAIDLVGVAAQARGRVDLPGTDARHFVRFLDPGQRLVATQQGLVFAGAVDRDQQARAAAAVIDEVAAHLHAPCAAIAQAQIGGDHAQLLGMGADVLQLGFEHGLVAGRPQRGDRHRGEGLAAETEETRRGRIDVEDRQRFQVIDQDRAGVAFEHLPVARFRMLQPRVGMQHVLGQRAQQQIDQCRAGHHEERAFERLPLRGGLQVTRQHLDRRVAAQDPDQGQDQIGHDHAPAVAAQIAGERGLGSGFGRAWQGCRHGAGRGQSDKASVILPARGEDAGREGTQ
jgi:hypothetical protein